MANEWRLITYRPLINGKFDGRVLALWVVSILLYFISPLSFQLYVALFITVIEIYRIKKGVYSMSDAIKQFMQSRFSKVKHGKSRSVFNSSLAIMLVVLMTNPFEANAGYQVIPPKEYKAPLSSYTPEQSLLNEQYRPKGGAFINNVTITKGGGRDVELGKLLTFILPSHYRLTFVSVEIASMKIEWYSDTWTLDQVLGNLAVRYGIMFEKMNGTANLRIDWLDEKRCLEADTRNRVVKTLCGTTEGYL